jgi:chemotaxis signal transduction protein
MAYTTSFRAVCASERTYAVDAIWNKRPVSTGAPAIGKPGTGRSNHTSNDRSSPDDERSKQLVSFRVGDEEFALEIERVQEIIRHQRLTRVPNSPSFVEGLINLHGKVNPVIALRKRFGMDHKPREGDTRIVVLEVRDMVVGIIVDSVPEVLRIPVKVIVDPPRMFESQRD